MIMNGWLAARNDLDCSATAALDTGRCESLCTGLLINHTMYIITKLTATGNRILLMMSTTCSDEMGWAKEETRMSDVTVFSHETHDASCPSGRRQASIL